MYPSAGLATKNPACRLGDTPKSLFHPGCTDQHGEHTSRESRSRQERRVSARIHRGKVETTCELILSFNILTEPLTAPATNPVFNEGRTLRQFLGWPEACSHLQVKVPL